MNGFMLFAKKNRLEYTQMYPGKDNRSVGKHVQILQHSTVLKWQSHIKKNMYIFIFVYVNIFISDVEGLGYTI